MSHEFPAIALTVGEPAGIGPDIALALAGRQLDFSLAVIADSEVLKRRAEMLGIDVGLVPFAGQLHQVGRLCVIETACPDGVIVGELNPTNSPYVLDCINQAVDGCLSGDFDAMVTGPVHKGVINDAGIPFSGHTEWIAERSSCDCPVMLLADQTLRVALLTTHLPLSQVPAQITTQRILEVTNILHTDLKRLYAIENPIIGVCGLNPHAGESGHLGREEIEIIEPALQTLRDQGMQIVGPLPADTAFTEHQLEHLDAVLTMYHDQGLPVIKHRGFGQVVNVTLGLPIIRTSVDHGTALDLAASGKALETSLVSAIELARSFALSAR